MPDFPNRPAATIEDLLHELRGIRTGIDRLVGMAQANANARAQQATPRPPAQPTNARPQARPLPMDDAADVANDHDLDSKYGDEKIKFRPRDWTGDDYTGKTMSQAPAAFLLQLAAACEWFAQKNVGIVDEHGRAKSDYDKRTAARARGWARRQAAGWTKPAPPPMEFPGDDPKWGSSGF